MSDINEDAELDALLAEEMAKAEEGSAVQTENESEAVEQESFEIPEELQPFDAWKPEAKAAWESLVSNAEYHDMLRQLRPQLDSDYKYRTQLEQERAELARHAQFAQQFQQVASQYSDILRGRNPVDVAGELFWYSQQLARNPQQTIQQLAQQYGVDLNGLVQEQPYVDEYTRQLQGQMSQMQQQFYAWQQQQHQQQTNQVLESARSFEFETDAEGNLLRPYVSEVANDMLRLMQAGYASNFQEAYDRACWANESVRAKLLKEQDQGKKLQQKEQAQKAKAAASAQPRHGKSAKSQSNGIEDLDDAIERAARDLAA